MPLFGSLDLDSALAAAPTITTLTPEAWDLPGAETLQVSYEVDEGPALAVTPSALHPSIPPYATFSVVRFPESPVGPFNLAMIRLIVRAGIRPRGLLIRAFTNSTAAAEQLSTGWGYDVSVAEVSFTRRHDHVRGAVAIDGRSAMEVNLRDPEPVAGQDIELFDNLHLVNAGDLVEGGATIIQVDPTYDYHRAERGGADLAQYDPELLGSTGIVPVYSVVGVACLADMALNPPRFTIDPKVPAIQGTKRVEKSAA